MRRAVGAACVAAGVALLQEPSTARQALVELAALTVPATTLSAGCQLSPAPMAAGDGSRVFLNLWAGLPITDNPYEGEDQEVTATIRERVVVAPALPDGPPTTRRQFAQFRLQAAADVAEAYAAIYADAERRLLEVYALRFRSALPATASKPARHDEWFRHATARTVVVAAGGGLCTDSVLEHLDGVLRH